MKHPIKRTASLSAVAITAMTLAACSDEGCRHTKRPDVLGVPSVEWASACAFDGRVYFTIGRKNKDGSTTAKTTFPDGSFLVQEYRELPDRGITEIHNPDGSLTYENDPRDSDAAQTKASWDEGMERYESEQR
jgi:hypothetical protein